MGKKILYGIEDYARDKLAQDGKAPAGYEAAIRAATPSRVTATPQGGAGYGIRGGSVYIKPASEQQRKFLTGAVKAPEAEAETPSDGLSAADKPLTERELMYRDVVNSINEASKNLLNVMNRQFRYDEKSSPLYSILQKQYEREAEKAAGQAYAASVANTGGYGSSYATMAGEAARRQVMAGFDDQQLALYEAAKQEFDAERQSALDWYNTAVGMKEQAAQLVDEERLMNAAKSSGMNEDTYNLMIQAANEGWYTGANKEALRARLNTIAAGNPEINVDAIMGRLTAETSAATTDAANQFAVDPTVSGAVELMNAAKASGTWNEVQSEISSTLFTEYTEAMESLNKGYAVTGNDKSSWVEMSDEEKNAQIIQSACDAYTEGAMMADDLAKILSKDFDDDMAAVMKETKKDGKRTKSILENIEGLMELKSKNQIDEEVYEKVIEHIIDTTDISENFYEVETMTTSGKRTGYQIAPKYNFRLTSGQTDALGEVIKVFAKTRRK